MKSRESKELHTKSETELMALVHDAREKLRVLRLDLAAGKVKNVGEFRVLRKDIARILTCLEEIRRKKKPGTR